jgi:hypothetical protein
LVPHNNSRQLGALRDLPAQGFDVLAAVLFQADRRAEAAWALALEDPTAM